MKIEDIKNAINSDIPIEYSMHCQKRMLERNISRKDIYNCIHTGEIILGIMAKRLLLYQLATTIMNIGKMIIKQG